MLGTAALRQTQARSARSATEVCCSWEATRLTEHMQPKRTHAENTFALPLLEPQPAEGNQLTRSSPNKRAEHDLFDKDLDPFN